MSFRLKEEDQEFDPTFKISNIRCSNKLLMEKYFYKELCG